MDPTQGTSMGAGGLLRQPRGWRDLQSAPVAQGGFTLIEIMVALAVIAVAFVALLGLRNRDIVLHDEARAVIMATALAQQRMADATIGGFPDLGTSEGRFDDAHARFTWRQEVSPTGLFSTDLVREVRVMVAWGEPSRNERVDLVSYVFQRPKTGGGA
jgi:general secretion pathway protein I